MKKLLRAFGLMLGIAMPILAAPSGPPAGRYIQNVSTNAATQVFNVSSGSVVNLTISGTCTGPGCGSGGGGGSTGGNIIASTQNNVGYYSAIATNTINGSNLFTWNGTTVTALSISASSLSVTNLSNTILAVNGSGLIISTTVMGGGGSGVTVYPATATASFPFGLTASTVAINGSGNFSFVNNADGKTYQVVGSSTVPTNGHLAAWSSSNTIIDGGTGGAGTPGGATQQVQYNNAGVFAGSSNFQFNGTSVTVVSSISITNNGAQNTITTPGLVDIYNGNAASGTPLLTIGSQNQNNAFQFNDQQPFKTSPYGITFGSLNTGGTVGGTTNHEIYDANSITQFINLWNGGEMDLQTTSTSGGGKNIVLKPQTIAEVTVSSLGVTISTGVTITPNFLTVGGQNVCLANGTNCLGGGGGGSTGGSIIASTQNNFGYYSAVATNTINGTSFLTLGTNEVIITTFTASSGIVTGPFQTTGNTTIGNGAAQVFIPNIGNGLSGRFVAISTLTVGNPLTSTALLSSDIPPGSGNYIQNNQTSSAQSATAFITSATVSGFLTASTYSIVAPSYGTLPVLYIDNTNLQVGVNQPINITNNGNDGNVLIGNFTGNTETLTSTDSVLIGNYAGYQSTAPNKGVFIGAEAGKGSGGNIFDVYVGQQAGLNLQCSAGCTMIGSEAGDVTAGTADNPQNTCVGNLSCRGLSGGSQNMVVEGYNAAGGTASGSNGVTIGFNAGQNLQGTNTVSIGNTSNGTNTNVGIDGVTAIGTLSVGDNTGAIALGDSANAHGSQSMAIGDQALVDATATGGQAFGYKTHVEGTNSVGFGTGYQNVALIVTTTNTFVIGSTGTVASMEVIGSTFAFSSGTITGQETVGTLQGAGLSACGDGTHAVSWSGGSFGCQTLSGGGGGSSTTTVQINGLILSAQATSFNMIPGTGVLIAGSTPTTNTVNLTYSADTSVMLTKATDQSGSPIYCASSNGTDSYTCSLSAAAILTTYTTGMQIVLNPDVSNTGAASLNIDNNGLKNIKQNDGTTDPATGMIISSQNVTLTYDGFEWRLPCGVSQAGCPATGAGLLNSTQTWTGGNTFSSWETNSGSMTLSGNVNISSGVLLSGAAGSNGQLLTSGGPGTVPTWTTVTSGSGGGVTVPSTFTWAGVIVSSIQVQPLVDQTSAFFLANAAGTALARMDTVALSTSDAIFNVVASTSAGYEIALSTFAKGPYHLLISTTGLATFGGVVNLTGGLQTNGSSGLNGQLLTSGGVGTNPTWTTVSNSGGVTVPSTFTWTGVIVSSLQVTSTNGGLTVSSASIFNGNVVLSSTVIDGSGSAGTSGQFLSSQGPGTKTAWASSANQTITISGDSSGSGTTSIPLTAASNQANINTLSASSITITGSLAVSSATTFNGIVTIATTNVILKNLNSQGTELDIWSSGNQAPQLRFFNDTGTSELGRMIINTGSMLFRDIAGSGQMVFDTGGTARLSFNYPGDFIMASSGVFTNPAPTKFTYGVSMGSATITSLSNTVLAVNGSGLIVSTTIATGTGGGVVVPSTFTWPGIIVSSIDIQPLVDQTSAFFLQNAAGKSIARMDTVAFSTSDAVFNVLASTTAGFDMALSTSATGPYHMLVSTTGVTTFSGGVNVTSISGAGILNMPNSGNMVATQNLSFNPNSSFGVVGSTAGDNAAAGNIGEFPTSVSSSTLRGNAKTLSTGVTVAVATITLTAGDWDIRGIGGFLTGIATAATEFEVSISTTSGVLSSTGTIAVPDILGQTLSTMSGTLTSTTSDSTLSVGPSRADNTSSVTYYLNVNGTFTVSTLSGYGSIAARRVR